MYTKENIIGIVINTESNEYELVPTKLEGQDFSLRHTKTGNVYSGSSYTAYGFTSFIERGYWEIVSMPEKKEEYTIY